MFHRHAFGDPCDRHLAHSANRLKLDISRDAAGEFEVCWELHGTVSPDLDPDEAWMHTTQDTNFVESLVAMFTQRRNGGAQ